MLWSALLLGIFGSAHCVAMCGPIVLALPLSAREKRELIFQSFLYHLGRVITYGLLGFCFGLLGWGIALAGYQKFFSVVLGILLILGASLQILGRQQWLSFPRWQHFWQGINQKLVRLFSRTGRFAVFGLGLLGGLLPCGLVYIALVGAIGTGEANLGGLYMLSFGFGTMPALLGLMIFGSYAKSAFRQLRSLLPYACLLFGILMIYRGLQLHIPTELSFWESGNFPIWCH
ncbi:MAG: sulfite exporter TauE/SafE family protein [Saprospiraceae bacterium]